MSAIEDKYNSLRKKLDSFGYCQPLSFGSMDLIYSLLNDILHCKSGYIAFKEMVNELLQKLSVLKESPSKQENKNIQHENNYFNRQVIQEHNDFQEILIELKAHITEFHKAYSDMKLLNRQHLIRIGELEEEISLQNQKLIKYEGTSNYSIDKRANLKAERTENKSCQTVSVNELDSDWKFLGEIEEELYKQKKSNHLSQCLIRKGRSENIVPLRCAFEKIKAERDYYCKEYQLLQERICQLFIENCSPRSKEEVLCTDNIKDCHGDYLKSLINRIDKLLKCKRSANHIKHRELQEMVVVHQRERAVLMLRCEKVEQKIQEIKKYYQNLSSDKNKIISENKRLQECLKKKDENLRNFKAAQQKTQVKLNDALLNLVAMSTENNCLKDKVNQNHDYIQKMDEDLVSLSNSVKTLSGLKQKAEAEVIRCRKRNDECENEVKKLKQELCRFSHENERITEENKHLVETVTKLNKHIRKLDQNLDLKRQRISDLKREIHHYISEVRKVEEAIESKEQDLQRILEIYSVVSDDETFALREKLHETSETDGNSVSEYFENINNIGSSNLENIELKSEETQELQNKEAVQ